MLKRLWYIFGPIIISLTLLLLLLLFLPVNQSHDLYTEKKAATALTPIVFKNTALKQQALSDPNHRFVPFFGSSEWTRLDSMHPSVLAEAYHRKYTPFLLGLKGAESLTQYFGMQQIKPELKNKKAVFVISPQWFIKSGQNQNAFNFYYASDQGYHFLEYAKNTAEDKYAAKLFLAMSPNSSLSKYMEKVAKGEKLSWFDLWQINLLKTLSVHEDALFARFQFSNNFDKIIKPHAKSLPKPYNQKKLYHHALALGRKNTSNNDFEISNGFFTDRIQKSLPQLKDSQRNFSYVKSPEYNDFQLLLSEFASNKTDVMFVIPPVNGKWQDYTGLSQKMYETTVDKIRFQLYSQGFTNIADLSKDGNKPYFMQDTIHFGWTGWLAFDQHVNKFLTTNSKDAPTYKLNNYFFTERWANKPNISELDTSLNH
ncbi:D-alanyl-lipoteichoic acid biosynthesis protein DltD [Pseudolactococcus plantarum]|uniref:D-alanyl-lipoteichoic acid biosynthesis protein DltD n=1 Tax=Pseudolactococcus plantarum TaxID=1365 RepID=UPI0008306566|nr:D-alanyl-lipoteichoic acid biosynthesis protein DltD [Lactococcus plantarum]HCN74736.1 D-alanyl-lipoteichoic acid biosynthesis protein DltD [Lactococcus sp.]